MLSALFVGATGLKTHGEGVNTVANNLSNVSTVGYKQQSIVFEDLISQNLTLGSAWSQCFNQRGLGAQVESVRTLFTSGSYEPGSSNMDLAITGKGFFQVTDGDRQYYTRAGNFRFNAEGWLNDPNGCTLTGIPLENGKAAGGLAPIKIKSTDAAVATNPPKSSSTLQATINTGDLTDNSSSVDNPFFSLLENWNGAVTNGQPYDPLSGVFTSPLADDMYSGSVPLKVYDTAGNAHSLTLYLDGAPSSAGGRKTFEFVLAANPEEVAGTGGMPGAGTGLLMAGTLDFSSSGKLVNVSAYTPGGDPKNLASWTPAPLADGLPQFSVQFAGQAAQTMKLDLGVSSASGAWVGGGTAADVKTDPALLAGMGDAKTASGASTAYGGKPSLKSYIQDGYPEGYLNDLNVTEDGYVRASYSNGQEVDLYEVPLFRFTSEDGLRREGNNLYSATEASGQMEYGRPGTFNYGNIRSKQLETSNVDMSREMVNLIVMQRGLQMNSKTITTADTMLQKALEIKR